MTYFDPTAIARTSSRPWLLVKQARFARVLELWHVDQLSTFCIAAALGIDELEVCELIDEAEYSGRGRRRSA